MKNGWNIFIVTLVLTGVAQASNPSDERRYPYGLRVNPDGLTAHIVQSWGPPDAGDLMPDVGSNVVIQNVQNCSVGDVLRCPTLEIVSVMVDGIAQMQYVTGPGTVVNSKAEDKTSFAECE